MGIWLGVRSKISNVSRLGGSHSCSLLWQTLVFKFNRRGYRLCFSVITVHSLGGVANNKSMQGEWLMVTLHFTFVSLHAFVCNGCVAIVWATGPVFFLTPNVSLVCMPIHVAGKKK